MPRHSLRTLIYICAIKCCYAPCFLLFACTFSPFIFFALEGTDSDRLMAGYFLYFVFTLVAACKSCLCWSQSCGFIVMGMLLFFCLEIARLYLLRIQQLESYMRMMLFCSLSQNSVSCSIPSASIILVSSLLCYQKL